MNKGQVESTFKFQVNKAAKEMSTKYGFPVKATYDKAHVSDTGDGSRSVNAVVTYVNSKTGQPVGRFYNSMDYVPQYGLDERLNFDD